MQTVAERLDRKRAERDELLNWLAALAGENAGPEAGMVVRAELARVLRQIEVLENQAIAAAPKPGNARHADFPSVTLPIARQA